MNEKEYVKTKNAKKIFMIVFTYCFNWYYIKICYGVVQWLVLKRLEIYSLYANYRQISSGK